MVNIKMNIDYNDFNKFDDKLWSRRSPSIVYHDLFVK